MKNKLKNLSAVLIGLVFSFFILELGLRIYNPLPATIKGDKVVLRANYKIEFKNNVNSKLPARIQVNGNSLGFRGPELTSLHSIKVLTVGGSTTRCMYSPDKMTWSFLLGEKLKSTTPNLWLNNAGFTGHSTFGHIKLMEEYLIRFKPDVILFLIGINDVERDVEDTFILQDSSSLNSPMGKIKSILYKSEVVALGLNILRFIQAKQMNLNHDFAFDLRAIGELRMEKEDEKRKLEYQEKYLPEFRMRLQKLIDLCKANNIRPILITQPALFGPGLDPSTDIDLQELKYNDINGGLMWKVLQLYNASTLQVAKENQITAIDLASELPKDSKYYWDFIHYTPEGNQKIAEILASKFKVGLKTPVE
ncbi:MAG: hypothetical protein CL840_16995 [Crocinitomicaceae bacterium]|nr:hypothetical protein [Crocinitomicaceae bacterium]